MAKPFFKKIAEDLLNLEINTIIKSEMSAEKMPETNREALYSIAKTYGKKLGQLNIREPIHWAFGGIRSFEELKERAKSGNKVLKGQLEKANTEAEKDEIRREIYLVERIFTQSERIVKLFERLKEEASNNSKKSETGYSDIPENIATEELMELMKKGTLKRREPHTASQRWNNDININQMKKYKDFDLAPEDITLIRKVWEIGIDRIVLQTFVQIDGDVTTRISEIFSKNPNKMVLKIHNDSISTSTAYWANIFKAFVELTGDTIAAIFGKKR